jgi:hypothetical protein
MPAVVGASCVEKPKLNTRLITAEDVILIYLAGAPATATAATPCITCDADFASATASAANVLIQNALHATAPTK